MSACINSKNNRLPTAVGGGNAPKLPQFQQPTFVAGNLANAPSWCWKEPIPLSAGTPRLWYATIQLVREVVLEFEGTRPQVLELPDFAILKAGVEHKAYGVVVFPYTLPEMPFLKKVTVGTSYTVVAAKVFESDRPVYVINLEPQGYVEQDSYVDAMRIRYKISLLGRTKDIGGRFAFIGDLCVIPESETKLTVYNRIRLMS